MTKIQSPHPIAIGTPYLLPRSVSAIQSLPADDGGRARLGLITQLPEGAEIEIEGPGFNERTRIVRCAGASYFLFLEDLEPALMPVALAAHA